MTTIARGGARNLAACVGLLASIILIPPVLVSCILSHLNKGPSEHLYDEEHALEVLETPRWSGFQEFSSTEVSQQTELAVLKFNLENPELSELRQEIAILASSLQRPNVLPLVGFHLGHTELLLFIPRAETVDELLPGLCWRSRCRVAVTAARGLSQLHHNGTQMLHGRISSRNIHVVDGGLETCTAYIGEAGLLKLLSMPIFQKGVLEQVSSTYTTPEGEALTIKADVYSFGVLLCVLLSGKTVFSDPVTVVLKQKLRELVDSHVGDAYDKQQAEMIRKVALKCVDRNPEHRPNMIEVEATLRPLLHA